MGNIVGAMFYNVVVSMERRLKAPLLPLGEKVGMRGAFVVVARWADFLSP